MNLKTIIKADVGLSPEILSKLMHWTTSAKHGTEGWSGGRLLVTRLHVRLALGHDLCELELFMEGFAVESSLLTAGITLLCLLAQWPRKENDAGGLAKRQSDCGGGVRLC